MRDQDLIAYADGELPNERRAVIEAALANDPTLRQRVESLRAMRRAARESMRADAPLPPMALQRKIMEMAEMPQTSSAEATRTTTAWAWPRWAFAAAAVLLIGLATAWVLTAGGQGGAIAGNGGKPGNSAIAGNGGAQTGIAILDHHKLSPLNFAEIQSQKFGSPTLAGPMEPTQAAFLSARPKLAAAAMKAIDAEVCLPDLFDLEYRYAGGEVFDVSGRPVIHLLYVGVSPKEKRLSIYMQRDVPAALPVGGIETTRLGDSGQTAVTWHRGDVLCHVIADEPGDARPAATVLAKRLTDILR